ncbi:MAG TPA: hypothetical protein VHT73_07820 [Thermodesulfobacteriota bacterium]|nr:hypothetical protein [Thermodesulfobacteriota bacterium]
MPEIISKYPDTVLKVLSGAGARCGEGVEQNILKECPPERFCSLPTGEICVYGIDEIPEMTQVTLSEIVAKAEDTPPPSTAVATYSILYIVLALLIFAFGLWVGGRMGKGK